MRFMPQNKCEFVKDRMDFNGMLIGKNEVRVKDEKTEIIKAWPKSNLETNIRSFLDFGSMF